MTRLRALVFVILPLTFATPAMSHHAFSPVYDSQHEITVTGVVTEFKFVNPHAMMYLDATDASGKVVKWVVEFDGRVFRQNRQSQVREERRFPSPAVA